MKAEVYPGIEVDDRICFGRPRIKGTGVTADIVADRMVAGEHPWAIARDYSLSIEHVLWALRWCLLSRDRRARLLKKARAK